MPIEGGPDAALLRDAPVGIVVCHTDGTVLRMNTRARQLLAAVPGGTGAVGKLEWTAALPSTVTSPFEEIFAALAADAPGATRVLTEVDGPGRRVELRRLDGDGVAVFLSDDLQGAPALHLDFALLRRVYPFGSIATFDEELRYLSVDGRGWDELGIDPATLVGHRFDELWDAATAERLAELATVALHGLEASQRISYGPGVYEIWAGPLTPSAGKRRGLFVSRDVTAEATHRSRADLLHRATDATTIGILVFDLGREDQPVVHVSAGVERLTGYAAGEVLGRSWRVLHGPETDAVAVSGIEDAIARREPHQVTLLSYRKDGSSFWSRLTLNPFDRNGSGPPTSYVEIREDVTATREAEIARDHQWRLAEVGTLAGSVAHDFNNLLMEVRGRVALCGATEDLDEMRREVAEIEKAADRGSVLVRQLLAYAARGARETTEGPKAVLVRDVVPAVRRLTPRSVSIEIAHPESPIALPFGQLELEQILLNLAKNAADAMPEGGRIRIVVEEGESKDEVVLTFSDNGSGIAPEIRERIFEPFFTTKGSGGTGLGLSSVTSLVERAGGTISVTSEEGHGTTFEIRLPRARWSDLEAPGSPARAPDRSYRLEGLSILLVEDQGGVREVLARLLERRGLRVTPAADGAEAWRVYQEDPTAFDLVLADRDMPSVSGDRLIRRILRADLGREVPPWLALMSGDIQETLDLPEGVATIQKPFEIDDLLEALEAVVQGAPPGTESA